METILERSRRFVDEGVDEGPTSTNPMDAQLHELAPDIAMVTGFSHVIVRRTGDGLVLFDTSMGAFAPAIRGALREWSSERIAAIVYTHGHLDHVGGAPVFVDEAVERGDPRPRVIAHEAVPQRFRRYELTDGYNAVINERQFGSPLRRDSDTGHRFAIEWVEPDHTYAQELGLDVGGDRLELHHAEGETDDHTFTWIPNAKAVCSGDLFLWVFPNAGNPQKVQRYPLEWAQALRAIAALEPELLLPAHGLPIDGRDRIAHVLDTTAGALEALTHQTLELMNAGARLDRILAEVRVPAELTDLPYLHPVYDEPEFVVRNVWRLYGGWYDGNPARLKPPPDAVLAGEVAGLAGGAATLAERARRLAADGDLRTACQMAEWAVQASPEDPELHGIRAEVYSARREAEMSLMARAIYGAAARDSDAAAEG